MLPSVGTGEVLYFAPGEIDAAHQRLARIRRAVDETAHVLETLVLRTSWSSRGLRALQQELQDHAREAGALAVTVHDG